MADLSVLRGQLDNYECYYQGNRFLGMTTVDLPDFNFLTNEVSGPGVMGNLAIPTIAHTESLEITLTWRNIHDELVHALGPHAHDFTLRGSQHNYNASTGKTISQPVRIDFRGLTKQSPFGKFERNEETESKTTFELIRYEIYVDNIQCLKYDKLNYIFTVNGEDFLADYRRSVGLDF